MKRGDVARISVTHAPAPTLDALRTRLEPSREPLVDHGGTVIVLSVEEHAVQVLLPSGATGWTWVTWIEPIPGGRR